MRILARLTFLPGGLGRTSPVYSGYRPQLRFAAEDWERRRIDFPENGAAAPGDQVNGMIQLSEFAGSALAGKLRAGDQFELAEGAKIVAMGTALEVAL